MNKKIKLSLLGTLIAGSALAISLPIVSCSSANQYLLTVIFAKDQDQKTLESAATKSLQLMLDSEQNRDDQLKFIKTWTRNSSVPNKLREEIFKIISFNDINAVTVPVESAVEDVVFASSEIPIADDQTDFEGPTVRIVLKKDWTTTSTIDIQIDKLFLKELPPSPYSLA